MPGAGTRRARLSAGCAALVVSCLLGHGPESASAQDLRSRRGILQDYNLTGWTEREGLRSPRVVALAQTVDGYLWLGTTEGVIRFDGTTFTPWEAIGTTPLPAARVAGLWPVGDGSFWVGYQSGTVVHVSGTRATPQPAISDATGGYVNSLIADSTGTVWVAARSGLLRVREGQVTRIAADAGIPDGPVLNAYEDRRGVLWISSNTGIFMRQPGGARFEPVRPASYFDHRVAVDGTGAIWFTDPRRGFQRLTGPPSAPSGIVEGPRAGLGVQILPSARGSTWVATLGQGLWRLRDPARPDAMEVLGADDGLANEVIRCLLEDREQNIWIGTDYGLYRLSRNKITPVQRLGVVRAVQGDASGVWVATSTGLIRFEGDSQRTFGLAGELPSPFVSALWQDEEDGALWIATDRGIAVRRRGRFERVVLDGIDPLNRIYSMTRDREGRLWLADYNRGLFRSRGTVLEPVDVPGVLDHRAVLSVHRDPDVRMWVALADGRLGFVTDEQGQYRFTSPVEGRVPGVRLNGVFQDRPGSLWLATSAGAWHYADGRITTIDEVNGLPSAQMTGGTVDRTGAVWLGTGAGVVRLDREVIARLEREPRAQVTYGYWDAYDGAAGSPLWFGTPSVTRDPGGRIWFVSANGLSVADPEQLRGATRLPPVVIQSVSVGSKRMNPEDDLVLPPRSSPVEIDYGTIMLSAAHKVRFRYRLENLEQEWTDAGTRRQALFTNLPPGEYHFRVMGMATDGSSSESTATLRFTVQPAFTQTPWFIAGLGVLVTLTLWSAWRVRLRYVQRQFALVINERIRMSREIHDTLLQSLIGVALQLDVLGSSDEASDETRATLTRVRRELEEDIRETRQSIWSLRSPKLEQSDLASIVRDAGRRITAGAPVTVRVAVEGSPRRLRLDVEQQILRIAEQALVNAVRHGSASEVDVQLRFGPSEVVLTVADNGRGFDQSRIPGESNFHYGLVSMRERAEEIGGRFSLRTEPGRGTAVEAAVPV
ncbi:MAG: two-component regulator propeller domain-containing protein [Vicinamibacterales bacterium]